MKEEKTVSHKGVKRFIQVFFPDHQLKYASRKNIEDSMEDEINKIVSEAIRLSRKEGEEKIRVIISDLQNIKSDFEWLWNNTYPDHESKQSDHFNIPANAITKLESVINQLINLSPKEERGE